MSTQGATLGRGTIRLPIWPVAALVAAAAAATIGISTIGGATRDLPVQVPSVVVGISHATPRFQPSVGVSGFENPGTSTSEAEFTPTVTWHRPVI